MTFSGMDSLYLTIDGPLQAMNTATVLLLPPGVALDGTPGVLDLDGLRRHAASRLAALPAFRWRVLSVPFGLGHPVVVEDRAVEIAAHVTEHVLEAPGSPAELDAACAELLSTPLDRGRPLWRLVLVRGLADGRQAVVLLNHHCLLDGVAKANVLRILVGEPGPDAPAAPLRPAPSRRQLVLGGLARTTSATRALPRLVRATWASAAPAKRAASASPAALPTDRDTPACSLNRESTGRRTMARTRLAVADLARVKDAAGVTLNDVALALVGGALRDYLAARGELPETALLACVPVGEKTGRERTFGNRMGSIVTTLATDVADPWERLREIGAVTTGAKQVRAAGDPELFGQWLEVIPPALVDLGIRHVARRRRNSRGRVGPLASCVVSHRRWELPTPVDALYIAGPPNNGVGVNVTLASHAGEIFVSIVCVDEAVPEPTELVEGLQRALAELLARVPQEHLVGRR